MKDLKLLVTLWPSFPHFDSFTADSRLDGIRLNSAMMSNPELDQELAKLNSLHGKCAPLYFDVKGRQLRIAEVNFNAQYLDIRLNHPISVATPVQVLFKAGNDSAVLERVEEDGYRLIFRGGPCYMVRPGESRHIKDQSLQVLGQQFITSELEKIEKVRAAGFEHYFLSYVQCQRDVDEFQELVGKDALIMLKIEDKQGLEYVARHFKKKANMILVAARGDLFVELDHPQEITEATKLIVQKDPEACVGSRLLLSVMHPLLSDIKRALTYIEREDPDSAKREKIIDFLMAPQEPSCADFSELAWLHDIGYRSMMLCDELCLRGELLSKAVDSFEEFRRTYASHARAATSFRPLSIFSKILGNTEGL